MAIGLRGGDVRPRRARRSAWALKILPVDVARAAPAQVARAADGCVLARTPGMPFKKILCAIDFSESSHAAMMVAAQMALESGAALTLVHVWQPPIVSRDGAALLADDLHADLVSDCNTGLAKARALVETVGAIKVDAKLLAGTAWDCLVKEAASDPAYDLIVVGTHGRTGLQHVLVGSVAEKVVRHAPCPVLVARRRIAAR
jgi:universal stress protein A